MTVPGKVFSLHLQRKRSLVQNKRSGVWCGSVVLWEPCARKPGYVAFCVYVCDCQHEENCNRSFVHPGHPLLIPVQGENAKLSFYSFLVKKHAFTQ